MNTFKPDIFYIDSEYYEPYFNMACDEYFLNLTDENKINGSLRFYHWSKKSISIGLFFNTDNLNIYNVKKDNITVVRRITGGKALLHKNDLTYSIILKKGLYNLINKKEYYFFIAGILQKALKNIGIESIINSRLKNKVSSPDCFNSISQYELSTKKGIKLIGSAQKIEKNSMLQHGSFLYNYNPKNIQKYLNNKSDLYSIDNKNNNGKIKKNILPFFKESFKDYFNLIEYQLSNKDIKLINKLAKEKYANDKWTFKK